MWTMKGFLGICLAIISGLAVGCGWMLARPSLQPGSLMYWIWEPCVGFTAGVLAGLVGISIATRKKEDKSSLLEFSLAVTSGFLPVIPTVTKLSLTAGVVGFLCFTFLAYHTVTRLNWPFQDANTAHDAHRAMTNRDELAGA